MQILFFAPFRAALWVAPTSGGRTIRVSWLNVVPLSLVFPLPRWERLGEGELLAGLKARTDILLERKARVNEKLCRLTARCHGYAIGDQSDGGTRITSPRVEMGNPNEYSRRCPRNAGEACAGG